MSVYRTDSIRPVLMVRWPDGSGWVVKQPGETRAQAVAALQREAAIYELAESAFSDRLLRHLPRMAEYDGAVHALVLERVGHLNAWAAMLGQAGTIEGLAAPVAAAYRAPARGAGAFRSRRIGGAGPAALDPRSGRDGR